MEKIIIVDPVGSKAGMDYYSDGLGCGIIKNDVKVSIISNFRGREKSIHYMSNDFCGVPNSMPQKVWFWFKNVCKLVRLFNVMKLMSPQMVIAHYFRANFFTFLLSLTLYFTRFPVSLIVHDLHSLETKDRSCFRNFIFKYVASKIVVHNQFCKKAFLAEFGESFNYKVVVVPHGCFVDLPKGATCSLPELDNIVLKGKVLLLLFGTLKPEGGLDLLLKATADLGNEILVIIAGKDPSNIYQANESIIDELQLRQKVIPILRHITDDERNFLFNSVDICVIPYTFIYQSGVLMMALSYGLPVLASDLEPNQEVITDGYDGFLFKSGSVLDLKEKLQLLTEIHTHVDVGNRGKRLMSAKYSWRAIGRRYVDIMREFRI